MLNLNDINERLKKYPEPKEVTEIRKNIKKAFKKLKFDPVPHVYTLDGIELPSVSSITHQYEPYVDWDEKAAAYAMKHNMEKEKVQRMWHENNIKATNSGTAHHLFGEMYMHFYQGNPDKICNIIKPQYEDEYLIPCCKKQESICQFFSDLYSYAPEVYPVMPETQVYMGINDMFSGCKQYAGTFDMLFAYKAKDGEYKLLIYDYKTNASLTKDYARQHYVHCLGEFSNFIDEPLSYYTFQLSAYSLCLQQLGYEIADRKLIWLKDEGTYEKITVPDVTERLLKDLKK